MAQAILMLERLVEGTDSYEPRDPLPGTEARLPRLDRAQARVLGLGLAVVSTGVAGTCFADTPVVVRFFDNLHWTAGYGTGALLAWIGWRKAPADAARLSFFLATTAYFFGQVLWDLQVASGWNPFPGPSDVFFSLLGPALMLGLALELRGLLRPAQLAAGLDILGISAAALAYTLTLYLPRRGQSSLLVTVTLVGYPVFLGTALGTALVVVLARRWRVTPSLGLFLLAIGTDAVVWAKWNLRTLENTLADGILLNYVFSYAAVGLGLGTVLWSPREVDSPRAQRVYYFLSSALPILLATGAGVALQQSPGLPSAVRPWVQSCSLLIVLSAVARQGLALAERDARLAAERHSRALTEQYHAALARQEQAQRLESLGTLTAGVAHDFNNLLMGIRSHATLALRDPAEAAASGEAILAACSRGAQIVHGMLAFGRQGTTGLVRRVNLTESVRESLRLLRAAVPSSIVFEEDMDERAPAIRADPVQVQQILMNLCTNAAHAIGNVPGRILVRTGRRRLAPGHATGRTAGVYAMLSVSDDGRGMNEETHRRIFEPFFSTKGPDEGSGMGLAVVHGIVSAARGTIECDSGPGRGATFTILWPEAPDDEDDRTALPANAATAVVEIPPGREILVVDDDPDITGAVTRYLMKRGLRATACNNPIDALSLVRAAPDRFAAVVCDLTMPYMRGDELCRSLREIAPDLPVILSSGTETEMPADSGFAAWLLKPYDLGELLGQIARVVR